jgi:hypothetical protein
MDHQSVLDNRRMGIQAMELRPVVPLAVMAPQDLTLGTRATVLLVLYQDNISQAMVPTLPSRGRTRTAKADLQVLPDIPPCR